MIGSRIMTALRFSGAVFALTFLGTIFLSQPASAAGEIYTWKDYRTITVTGGDLKAPSDIILSGTKPTGDQSDVLVGNILYNKGRGTKGCTVSVIIYIFKSSGNSGGRLWNPPPYNSTGIGDPNAPATCSSAGAPEMDAPLHDQWITIGGTRPADPNAPEREDEKRLDVYVYAPDPLNKVPPSDTVFIYRKDGTKVGEQSSPFKDDSGAATWPPDQTPAAMSVTFNLDPGEYLVCDTYVAKECDYTKAPANQKFTKEKYKASSVRLGAPFQTPDKKRVNGRVEYNVKRPCGSTLDVSPIAVEVTGPNGQVYKKFTPPGKSVPGPNEEAQICTVDVMLGFSVVFDDMPAGDYKACATGAQCVTFTKKDGEAASFTLVIETDQTAPPNEKVCTSGEGIAGGLAWILCPATQLIASGTQFLEENIIIPFMTVSPLTTNDDNPVYILWRNVRDFANVGFIVILLIGLISIAAGKYGYKRMMPRIFIVIFGINLWYFVMAFLIDAFNIFGAGASQLIMAALQNAGTTQLDSGTSAGTVRSIFTLGGAALVTVLLTGGAAIGWLFSFIGLAALSIAVGVLVLIGRQLGIIALAITSPIPIVLSLLPNDPGLFKKSFSLFMKLLAMYPLMVLLFAGGKILGVFLQQPDFVITGEGVSEEVAQGVRVGLQFTAFSLPLIMFPAVFAFGGAITSGVWNRFNKSLLKPRGDNLKRDASQLASEAKLRMAKSGIPGVKQAAGFGMRRQYVRDARKRNLQSEQDQFLASAVSGSGFMRRQAAGVGGTGGQTRAAASAAQTAQKGRDEDLKSEMALLNDEMRRVGVDEKTFATAAGDYFSDPSKQILTGSNGQTFDFAANETRLQRALLNSAASQGEIMAVEAARANSRIDQAMVDDIIRRNDGELKGKGGYHLATNFNLAAGRIQVHDPGTGAQRAPASQDEINNEIVAQRLVAMANTGANSIANMKSGMLDETASMLGTASAQRSAVLQAMNHISTEKNEDYRAMLQSKIAQIVKSRETVAQSDMSKEDWEAMARNLNP